MSEAIILAAILAPLLLVPAFTVSFMSHVDTLDWPITEIKLPTDAEIKFAAFEREMLQKIASALGMTYVEWRAEYAPFAIPVPADFLDTWAGLK